MTRYSSHSIYTSVVSSLEGLTDDPVLPRKQRRPRRLDDGDNPHHFATPEDRYRQLYFEVLDYYCGELEKQFDQSHLVTVSSLELLESTSFHPSTRYRIFILWFVRTVCNVLKPSNMVKEMLSIVHKVAIIYLS